VTVRLRPNDERRFIKSSIPPGWSGETAVLIACGPSVTKAQIQTIKNAFYAGNCRVMVVNRAYEIAPFADAMYAADEAFWTAHIEIVRDTHIPLLFCAERHPCEKWGLWWTPGPEGEANGSAAAGHMAIGISEDPSYIHFGLHSGFQALNVAFHLGAKRIVLVGYDAHHNGGKHFHEDHPEPMQNAAAPHMWLTPYTQAAPQLIAKGVEVINCSPGSAIRNFPFATIGAVL